MLHVQVSGSVWSSLIFDNVRQQGDKEGFLIGEVSMQEMTNISDSQINKTTRETTVTVISHTICPKPFSFYNRLGQIDRGKLEALLKNNYSNVVGWFRCRSGSIPEPSLREITLHHHLRELLGAHQQTFIFGVFGEGSNVNHTTITYYYNFYTYNNGFFSPQRVVIENLGDTAQSDYRQGSSLNSVSSGSDCYRQILNSHKKDMIDKDGYLLGMQGIKKTNDAIHEKMKILKDSVVESEEEVKRLVNEIKMLEQRVQLKRDEKQRTEMAASSTSNVATRSPSPSEMEMTQDDLRKPENELTHKKLSGPDTKTDRNEKANLNQNANGSNSNKVEETDPFFGSLIKDMKASIKSPAKPRSNSDQVRGQPKEDTLRAETMDADRKLRSHSGSEVRTGNLGELSSQGSRGSQESRDNSNPEDGSESDLTQMSDSPSVLEPSGSQTF